MAERKKSSRARPDPSSVAAALVAAAISVPAHVMGKAVRDTLFLTTFDVKWLPYFFLATGLVSGFAVSAYTRLTARLGPHRVLPALSTLSACMLPLLWLG